MLFRNEKKSALEADQALLSGFRGDVDFEWNTESFPPMLSRRRHHQAVKLDEHRIMVMGGQQLSVFQGITMSVYDSHTQSWTTEGWPPLQQFRYGHAACVLHNVVYVIGGKHSSHYLDTIECLDLGKFPLQWVTYPSQLACGRAGCAAVAVDKYIYIIGGYTGHHATDIVEVLDTDTGYLLEGPSLTMPRWGCTAALVGTTLYTVGGYTGAKGKNTNTVETLSVGRSFLHDDWAVLPHKMSVDRFEACSTVMGHCLVVIGGRNNKEEYLQSVEVYDTKRGTWWRLPDLQKPRWAASCVTLGDNRILVFGGFNGTGGKVKIYYDSVEELALEYAHRRDLDDLIHELEDDLQATTTSYNPCFRRKRILKLEANLRAVRNNREDVARKSLFLNAASRRSMGRRSGSGRQMVA